LRRRFKPSIMAPSQHQGRAMIEPLGGPIYWVPFIVGLVIAYLIGSIPFGLLVAKAGGAGDIREIGSGNIGATNVLRTGRKGLALATLVLDVLKGALPVWFAYRYFGPDMAVVAGLGAVVGHCFPVWLRFRGGKGVATAIGVVLALTPTVALGVIVLFAAIVALTRYVSLASILGAAAVGPLAFWLGHFQAGELYLALALLIVLKHAGNIHRLVTGQEARLSFGGPRDIAR
jgi:glycerol-3-phosphate acyltransferase PlsY